MNEEKTFRSWSSTSLIGTPEERARAFRRCNKQSLDLLQSYSWPGNIRELQNVIERSVIVCETGNICRRRELAFSTPRRS